jgi:hypothetical protein
VVSAVNGVRAEVQGFAEGKLEVQFNPTEYSIERDTTFAEVAVPGLDSPVLQYVRGGGDKLNFELFLDVTDLMENGLVADGSDVRERFVRPLERLMVKHEILHAPPVVALEWGRTTLIESAVATSLNVKYTLFDTLGRPVRATATIGFRQHTSAARQIAAEAMQSPDASNVAIVREGDTLPAIASREYGDATRWRPIAEANSISNPLALTPGQPLIVPKVV